MWRVMHVNRWIRGGGWDGEQCLGWCMDWMFLFNEKMRELPLHLETEESIDFLNFLPLPPSEFNLRNNGCSVGIMWEVAHAAVTNPVITSSHNKLLWNRHASPLTQNAARLDLQLRRGLLDKQAAGCRRRKRRGGGRRWWSPPEPLVRICFLSVPTVDSPAALPLHGLCWSGSWCAFMPVRARSTAFRVILLLPYWAEWFTYFLNKRTPTLARRTVVHIPTFLLKFSKFLCFLLSLLFFPLTDQSD